MVEAEQQISGWTVDTLHEHFQKQLDNIAVLLSERYATQTKAIDAAFVAQQTAMQTAFTAADRAVQAALDAAKEAVAKQDAASEKRFESVNEFRAQLGDQVRTFAPREFVEGQLSAIDKRLQDMMVARQSALDEARSLAANLLPREIYEQGMAENRKEREAQGKRISDLEAEIKAARRASAAYAAALGIGLTVIMILIGIAAILIP